MSDLVENLEALAMDNYEMLGDIHVPLLSAANEIRRLRKALKDAKVELAELRYELNGPRR